MEISKKEYVQYKEFLENQLGIYKGKIEFIEVELKVLETLINNFND